MIIFNLYLLSFSKTRYNHNLENAFVASINKNKSTYVESYKAALFQ